MTCTSARELLAEFLDEELESPLRFTVQGHLGECRECSAAYSRMLAQQSETRLCAPHYEAPEVLSDSIQAALKREAASDAVRARVANTRWRWAAVAASILLCASLAWNLVLMRSRTSAEDVLAENLFSSHVRSLIGTHLVDVPSSDQHTVKPWFNGKLDYSPDVKDLSGQGFPLIGGRVDYLSGRAVGALVYRRRQHLINLFTWPERESSGVHQSSRNGYNLVHWSKDGANYWAVSDLNLEELQQFHQLLEQ